MIIHVHLWTKTSLMYIHVEHFLSKICISREFLVRRSDISFCHWTQKYILQHFFTNLYLLYVFEHVRDESSLWEPKNVKPEFMRYVLLHYKYSLGPIAYCEYKNIYFIDFNSTVFSCSFIVIKKLFAVNNHNNDNENCARMSIGICVNI